MGMNKKYSGFTLVEMLIVMGIIIILMGVGIAAGRFAIQRANDVAHQNAADQLFTAVQSYLTDEREYPVVSSWAISMGQSAACTPTSTSPCLDQYLTSGEFRGGTDSTYYYWTDGSSALVCVSKGGLDDADLRGYYCTGNAFGATGAPSISTKDVIAGDLTEADFLFKQDWINDNDAFDPAESLVATS